MLSLIDDDGPSTSYKLEFSDAVHHGLRVTEACAGFIYCEPFQRLHGLKQLGVKCGIFPSANHTRKEHSLGVAHLARRFAYALCKQGPAGEMDRRDVILVELAGNFPIVSCVSAVPFNQFWLCLLLVVKPSGLFCPNA